MQTLKWIAATLGIPGGLMSVLIVFVRVHDMNVWVTAAANFAFYFALTWIAFRLFGPSSQQC